MRKSITVYQFLLQKAIVILEHPFFSSDMAVFDYLLFSKLKILIKSTPYKGISVFLVFLRLLIRNQMPQKDLRSVSRYLLLVLKTGLLQEKLMSKKNRSFIFFSQKLNR